jgi:endo-1,4-beta-xylanase
MKRYQDLGLDVHITELDIKCKICGENWSDADLKEQADVYEKLLDVCLSAANCRSFETWGFTDKYSWLPDPQDGLPMDRQMKANPAYDALYAKLESFPRDHAAVIARNRSTIPQENVEAFLQ